MSFSTEGSSHDNQIFSRTRTHWTSNSTRHRCQRQEIWMQTLNSTSTRMEIFAPSRSSPRSPTPLHTWTIRSCRHKPHDTSRGRQPPTRPRGWLRERGHDAIPSTITLAERSTIAPFLNSPPTSIRHHNQGRRLCCSRATRWQTGWHRFFLKSCSVLPPEKHSSKSSNASASNNDVCPVPFCKLVDKIRSMASSAHSCFPIHVHLTVQTRLGHKDVSMTMIYAYVLNRDGRGIHSPADRLGHRPSIP